MLIIDHVIINMYSNTNTVNTTNDNNIHHHNNSNNHTNTTNYLVIIILIMIIIMIIGRGGARRACARADVGRAAARPVPGAGRRGNHLSNRAALRAGVARSRVSSEKQQTTCSGWVVVGSSR